MKMKNIQLFLYYIKKEIIFINLIYRLASSAYFSILNINITIFDEYTDVYQNRNGTYDDIDFIWFAMILLIFSNISYSGNSLNQIIHEK